MPLTLTVTGPAADAAPDGPPPPLPEVFAALLSASAPTPTPTPTPTPKGSAGQKKPSSDEVVTDPAKDDATSAAALLPADAAASWLLAIGIPKQALIVHARGADSTTPLPGVGAATAIVQAKASSVNEPSSLPQMAGAPGDLTPRAHVPSEAVSPPVTGTPSATPSIPSVVPLEAVVAGPPGVGKHSTPPDPATTPAATPLTTATDPTVLGLGAAALVGAPHEVDRTEALAAVRPALVAAAGTLRTEGGRTSLVIRLDPPELGALLVRMTVRDGQVELTVRAPDAAAHGGLLAQTADLQQVLRDAGLDLTSYDVSYGGLTGDDQGEQQGPPERGTPRSARTADGTVHVTDDVPDPQPAGTWL